MHGILDISVLRYEEVMKRFIVSTGDANIINVTNRLWYPLNDDHCLLKQGSCWHHSKQGFDAGPDEYY